MAVASIVDTKALLETVAASLVAGVGITIVFSFFILGMAQLAEARRDGRTGAALAAGAMAALALVATLAGVAAGIAAMAAK